MVEAMGGRITLETAVGRGSTFTVCVPALGVEEDPRPAEGVAAEGVTAEDVLGAVR